ncbi:MAG: S41 family peptidase, partial [Alphaproteobacteria bacterium]|nr:S41 family peptidase [Alphaproteobacteria bacterium]
GIEVTMENNLVKVVSPIDDTPAARAGIQPLDLITHIDNKPVADLTLNDAVDLMRGKPGTDVTLTIRRGGISGQPFEVTLTRAVIRIQSVRSKIEGNDVGYIRITTFNEQTQQGLENAIAELNKDEKKKLIGYVIDLRNNPGGLLDQAVSVAGSFLPLGTTVVETRGRQADDNQNFTSRSSDLAEGKPIVVLINGGSASASEIVAGALQDHKRGIVLGTKSFGKGSVQTIIPLGGSGGAMRLTTARYYTPNGRSIQAEGIVPDIEVQPARLEEIAQGMGIREADLKGALPNPNKSQDGKSKEDAKPKAAPPQPVKPEATPKDDKDASKPEKEFDYQLARAVDLLRGLNLYQQKAN